MVNNLKGQPNTSFAMDMANNSKGREIGRNCPIKNTFFDQEKSRSISGFCSNKCNSTRLTVLDF